MGPLIPLLVKTIVLTFGQRIAEKLATEVVCSVTQKCPEKIDTLAEKAKAQSIEKKD